MIELYLDGMRAIPNKDMSIKVTAENPYFSKSASYTYDVDLPLDVQENLRIFGHINRIDVTKESKRYAARLIVDNQPVIVGEAHITSISDKSVKVQLLGEGAAYNFGNKADKLYVDELDMGNWYEVTWPDWSAYGWKTETGDFGLYTIPEDERGNVSVNDVYLRCLDEDAFYFPFVTNINTWLGNVYGSKYPWVAYPILNSSTDEILNRPSSIESNYIQARNMVIQPYLWKMAEFVAKATGFTLDPEENGLYTNEFFRKIFVATATSSILCARSLPHWTVNEWWSQIEQTFGLVTMVDYTERRMRLVSLGQYYGSIVQQTVISDVADEFSSEMDSDELQDITNDSVGFDADFGSDHLLPESVTNNASIIDTGSSQGLFEWAKINRDKLGKNCVWRCSDGRHFIYQEGMTSHAPGFLEVDMCRPRMTGDNEDTDPEIEIKIVPCALTVVGVTQYAGTGTQYAEMEYFGEILEAPGADCAADAGALGSDTAGLDIEAVIAGEEEPEAGDNIETMYIAIANNGDWATQEVTNPKGNKSTVKLPKPITVERMEMSFANGQVMKYGKGMSLSLIDIEGLKTLASESLSGAMKINTGARMAIKFLSDTIPDVSSIFMIRNKRFVCHKIEATVKPDGLDRLLTGYFYELL